jgi:RHS repeat-associated protein
MLASACAIFAQENIPDTVRNNVPDFDRWTEEQIQEWEDSVKNALYPQPAIESMQVPAERQIKQLASSATVNSLNLTNSHVPDSYPVDQTKDVGEIPMTSTVTPAGAVTYNIPIEISPGRQGFQPQLAVTYNSLGGNGMMGAGWNVGGLSAIVRAGKSIYHDGKSQGVALTKDDAFILDGTRLIKIAETSTEIDYETEQGLVKVKAFLSGGIIRYFEVSYPNGNKGIFGYTTNSSQQLGYPITSLTDLRGNVINYTYTLSYNRYLISAIYYTGASVTFQYATTRPDPVVSYEGGLKVTENQLLQSIDCKSNGTTFRTYEFTYQTPYLQNTSMLTQIGCTASGKSLNPLRFYYGEGNMASTYTKAETQLLEWYTNAQPGQLIVSKGKFNYGTDDDGLISLPNKNPYWQHYRNPTWIRHSQDRYVNQYEGTEKIFLYSGLNGSFADPMPNLTTEAGFTDIFCANIDGKYEEEVIKVNNTVSGSYDRLQFKVYSVNLYTGLALKYTRAFNFSTVLTDADGWKSIHPKFHFTGDFNGDGKMEVLSVSNNHPFGWTDKSGRCYLFDLDTGTKLYEGTPFAFYKEFVGTQQGDAAAAAQNSDRLFALDYDGDGKTDICLINDNGTYIYTFDVSGSSYSVRQVSSYTALKKSTLEGRQLMIGEFNGDGKPDFLLSTQSATADWAIYYAMGNGQFERVATSITSKSSSDQIILQDVNSDGLTDVIKTLGTSGFFTYLTKPGAAYTSDSYSSFNYTGSVLVPTDINSRNYFHQLVALKDGKVTRFSYPRNDTKEKQLTGSVNSSGVVNKNYYRMLNEAEDYYARGYGAAYPFENFYGPLSVPVSTEQLMNGQRIQNTEYRYENAVIHKQGRGFCGFGRITTIDNTRGRHYSQEYDPYNFGILKVDDSPTAKITNTWSVNVQSNKIVKIRRTNSSALNNLTSQTVTSTYLYDTYGNVTRETLNYGGGVTAVTDQTFYNSTSGGLYLIGQPLNRTVTNTRGGSSWIDKEAYTYNDVRLPLTRITYTGTSGTAKTGETRWTYDTNWNVASEISAPYNVTEFLDNTYNYDTTGRFIASVTNALGQNTEYADHDEYGNARIVYDHKRRVTRYYIDAWGRPLTIYYPDGITESTVLSWGGEGLYTVTSQATGSPSLATHYDALGREIRNGNQRFDGQWQYVDTQYDSYGRPYQTSLPFKGSSATLWNSYTYDSYDRPTRLTEASGKTTSWSYNGLSVTETKNGIATTKTTDASGALASVTDPGGTISYSLRPDGQPSSITAPGSVVTSFEYDAFGRQTALVDPSAGRQTTEPVYSSTGVLTLTETNPKGTNVSVFDKYGRITSLQRQGEFTTNYVYNADELLVGETSTNGTSKAFTYDTFDRIQTEKETVPDSKWLQKTYTYGDGNVSSVQYAAQSGTLGTESFLYAYGHNTEIRLNGSTTIWKLTAENDLGQPTAASTGSMNRSYSYNDYGIPTGRTAGSIQNFSYSFDTQKGNLLSRTDNRHTRTESFSYDNLNRLTNAADKVITYADNGNITRIEGVGTMAYGNTDKPYQVTMLSPEGTAVPLRNQSVSYTSFQRPSRIDENGLSASFTYNASGGRVKMYVANGVTPVLTRYYIGGQYELDLQSNIERLYLGGDAYSAPAVLVKEAGVWNIYYICRDYLGSITHVANADGSLAYEYSYDAWGRLRDPATQAVYTPGSEPALFLGRGYTGHEHLPWFGLINMNARLYDATLGRFLSPDPYVQMPDFTQSFNRYSYCINNPLLYFDLTGYAWYNDFWDWLKKNSKIVVPVVTITVAAVVTVATAGAGSPLLVAAIGGAAGGFAGGTLGSALEGKKFGEVIGNGFLQAGIGALSGFVGGAAGQWAAKGGISLVTSGGAKIASPVIKGALTGVIGGAAGGLAGGFTAGFTMSMIATKGDFSASLQAGWDAGLNSALTGAGIGFGAGAFTGYKYAKANNLDLWSGKSLKSNINPYNGKIVTNPAGDKVTIDIPSDYIMRPADNGNGMVYQAPGSIGNANMIRIMGPTTYAPNGYSVFYNSYGQPINPNTGETLGRALWHFKF